MSQEKNFTRLFNLFSSLFCFVCLILSIIIFSKIEKNNIVYKTYTGHTSAYMGICTNIKLDGIEPHKIIAANVFVDFGGDENNPAWVPNSFEYSLNYKYAWYITQGPNPELILCNDSIYSKEILNHFYKVVISYKDL